MQKQFPRGVLQEEGVLQMCCEFLGGVSMHRGDFNKVTEQICGVRASAI